MLNTQPRFLILALAGAVSLGACTNSDNSSGVDLVNASRIVFDPAAGQINLPNDLFFAVVEPTQDGTLQLPAEVASSNPDLSDPAAALGALDGWSTQQPFVIDTQSPVGVSLDADSIARAGSVRLFEGSIGGDINDPDCTNAPPLSGCKINRELVFGSDFTARASGNQIQVVPLQPLKESTSYYVVLTDQITAGGRALIGSTAYQLLSNSKNGLASGEGQSAELAKLIQSIEGTVTQNTDIEDDQIIYSFTFTTESTTQIIDTVKRSLIAPYAQLVAGGTDPVQAASSLPSLSAPGTSFAPNAMEALELLTVDSVQAVVNQAALALSEPQRTEALSYDYSGLAGCAGLIQSATGQNANQFGPYSGFAQTVATGLFAQVGPFCAAGLQASQVNLPYYLNPEAPLTGRWQAACTNGLVLRSLGQDQITSLLSSNTISAGDNQALCQSIGLADLNLSGIGINDPRYITRYSPLPIPQGRQESGTEQLSVQITVPDPAVIDLIAQNQASGLQPIVKPASGWPVVILQHGITSKKEDMLALTSALSLAGFATVAIDHPLHGSRGLSQAGNTVNASSGFGGSVTDYLNLSYLLTTRDNVRQSIVDVMGLRLALSASDLSDLNTDQVGFFGHSLGAITGVGSVAALNRPLGGSLGAFDSRFAVQSAAFNAPGGGIAGFLIDSPSFSPLIKGSLLAASSTDFQGFLATFAQQNSLSVSAAVAPAFSAFAAGLSAEQTAQINALFNRFVFAAQTIIDPADPNNFAGILSGSTPVLFQEIVGGGTRPDQSLSPPDQVIPNRGTQFPSYAGTEPLAQFAELMAVTQNPAQGGLVRFVLGGHSSVIDPSVSLPVTTEMQRQIATFFASGGTVVVSAPALIQGS